jgi:nicotinate dehydrogenase subunit B
MNLDPRFSRRTLLQGGALTIGFALFGVKPNQAHAQGAAATTARTLSPEAVDAYFVMNADSSVTLYCGKVDLGQGLGVEDSERTTKALRGIVGKRLIYKDSSPASV